MTKRMAATEKGEYDRDPHNFYREPRWCVEQLADLKDSSGGPMFGDDLIFDPCCGTGNVLDVFKARGHPTYGQDVVDRGARHPFRRVSFLQAKQWPSKPGRALSIVTNPPYGRQEGYQSIAGEIIHRALHMIPFRRAAFLLPIEFVCGQDRYAFFRRWRPSHIAYCSQRPSMPPGAMVEALGEAAFKGGMADYCWIIFTPPHRWRTESIWLKPQDQ